MIIMLDEELNGNEVEKDGKSFIQKIRDFWDNINSDDFSDNDEAEKSQKKSEIKDRKTEFSLKSLFVYF